MRSVASSASDDLVELTEKLLLVANIIRQTYDYKVGGDVLELHHCGRINAMLHLFRRNATHVDIEETLTAVLLPLPLDGGRQLVKLTMSRSRGGRQTDQSGGVGCFPAG